VTVQVAERPVGSDPEQGPPAVAGPAAHRPRRTVRAGQVVATQVALAMCLAALGRHPLVLVGAGLAAVAVLLVTWFRLRGRWLFEWLAIGLRHLGRPHGLAAPADPAALLALVAPGARVVPADLGGDTSAVVSDGYGVTAVLELGDPAALVVDAAQQLPSPADLLPAPGPDLPPVRVQLLLTGAPAPAWAAGAGAAATSYRQLTDGRLAGHDRALLAVRVLRAEGWSEDELRRSVAGVVRKIRRRLAPLPARPLGERAALGVLAELAHHDPAQPVRESWSAVALGGLAQATFRLRRLPSGAGAQALVSRLLALPALATTVSIGAGPHPAGGSDGVPAEVTVRLAAADPATLTQAGLALRELLTTGGADGWRLDGEQLSGLAATLPLGTPGGGPLPPAPRAVLPAAALDGLELTFGAAGLMIGANRRRSAVVVRLFRAEATRVMLVGGVRAAQLVVLRALALGARVVVQTARPGSWEPFVRGVGGPGETIPLVPPGAPVGGPPGTPLRPRLVVVDVGPVAADQQPGPGWQATLVVRDELGPVDVDALSRSDLVMLQPLGPDEAALAGAALGLSAESTEWLSRIQADMVGLVNRRVLRWVLLSATPVEAQLVGSPTRR
jgi:type VII secretion protein EccE